MGSPFNTHEVKGLSGRDRNNVDWDVNPYNIARSFLLDFLDFAKFHSMTFLCTFHLII